MPKPAFLSRDALIALGAVAALALHVALRVGGASGLVQQLPLWLALALGGAPLVWELLQRTFAGEFASDLLAGISIVVAVLLGEHVAAVLVVLMLSGGQALERLAVRRASAVLAALAKRMPAVAHRRDGAGWADVPLEQIRIGDLVVILPHETCPVDGTVVEGRGAMDESFLTGEPYLMEKAPGAAAYSGAINGVHALTLRATKLAIDSRYAKVMETMRAAEQRRPRLRRLGDTLGAWYTPLALAIALAAWGWSGDPRRLLAVLVVATPCPLLLAIPVAIVGAISLAARRGILVKDPAILETLPTCRTAIFDKTGTLTYGRPHLAEVAALPGHDADDVLQMVASLERYSKHPLAAAIVAGAERARRPLLEVAGLSEQPGDGLRGAVTGRAVQVTSREKLLAANPAAAAELPPRGPGLECVALLDDRPAAVFRLRDEPRGDGSPFVAHLSEKHAFARVMLVSGDRESEVRYLAEAVGIGEVRFSQSPEQKLELVRAETKLARTVFVGDGINDAPALAAATAGIAFGSTQEIAGEAAGAVVLESSLRKVDELMHIGARMRRIALQSAVGGIALSIVGMAFAAMGMLPPVAGALAQEAIDVLAVGNALRAAAPFAGMSDYPREPR